MVWFLISRNRGREWKKWRFGWNQLEKFRVVAQYFQVFYSFRESINSLFRRWCGKFTFFLCKRSRSRSFLAFFPPVINSLMSLLLFGNLLYKSLIFQKVSANSTYFSHPSLVGFRIEKLFVLIDFINVNRY